MEGEGQGNRSSDFGALLRGYRLAAGLSQADLAERAHVSADAISALERGYRSKPQRETLELLVGALTLDLGQRRAFELAATRRSSPRRRTRASAGLSPRSERRTPNVPLAPSSFIGREAEVDELIRLVRDGRLVTITGAGGIGKTQIALQAATVLNGAVVWFVGLAPATNSSLVVATIASTIGVQEVPGRPLIETLLAYLRNKSVLLILDNCEHVIVNAASIVDTVLGNCPRAKILATSREPLRCAGEYVYRLPSLRFPSSEAALRLSAADAVGYAAIALFADRARAANHHFRLTDENAPIVADLCRRLDGIPLAIELAAARVNSLSVKAIEINLEDRFRILIAGKRTVLPRQQTMRATIDWSYDLLSTPEKRLFERLSVFAGGCTLNVAVTVCTGDDIAKGSAFELLSSLVDKSMVVADLEGRDPRYRLLESFREYAQEKIATRSEREILSRYHALACLELAERLECAHDSEPDENWRAIANDELDNWRVALQWALIDRGDVVLGQRLVGKLLVLWKHYAPLEGQRWIASALALIDERTVPEVSAGLSYASAMIAEQLQEYKVELASSENAFALYRSIGDSLGMARAQSMAGHALVALGQPEDAQKLLLEALVTARELGNQRLTAWIQQCLGYTTGIAGDFIASRDYLADARRRYERLGARGSTATAIVWLGLLAFRAGDTELALRRATEAFSILRSVNDLRLLGMVLCNMSVYLVSLGQYDQAKQRACEALKLAREHHQDVHACWALQSLAAAAALRPQVEVVHANNSYARTAQILGFVDHRLATMGSGRYTPSQQEYDRVFALLSDAIGPEAVAKLMAEGAQMTEHQVVEEAFTI